MYKKMVRMFLVCLMILGTMGMSSVWGRIIYVNDSTSGPETGSYSHPYKTIKQGIDASFSGDSV